MKKLYQTLLVIFVSITNAIIPIYADNNSVSTNSVNVSYIIEDNKIIETTEIACDKYNVIAVKEINKDNTYILKVTSDNDTQISAGRANYNTFLKYANHSTNSLSEIDHNSGISLAGTELSNTNFKHLKYGTNSETIYKSDIDRLQTAAALYSHFWSVFPSLPGGVIAWTADIVLSEISSKSPYKMVISETTYEVRFKNDNNYYCMCYHDIIYSYNSSGKLTSTKRDYYQGS